MGFSGPPKSTAGGSVVQTSIFEENMAGDGNLGKSPRHVPEGFWRPGIHAPLRAQITSAALLVGYRRKRVSSRGGATNRG